MLSLLTQIKQATKQRTCNVATALKARAINLSLECAKERLASKRGKRKDVNHSNHIEEPLSNVHAKTAYVYEESKESKKRVILRQSVPRTIASVNTTDSKW